MKMADCKNIFSERQTLEHYQANIIAGLNTSVIPCVFISNLLIIITLMRTKQTKCSRTNNLFICFAIGNCLMAVTAQPMITALFTAFREDNNCLVEITTHFLVFIFTHFSGFTILSIGIDEYIQLKNIQWYKYAMTRKRAVGLLFSVGVLVFSISIGYVMATIHGVHEWISFVITLCYIATMVFILTRVLRHRVPKKKNVKQKVYKLFPGSSVHLEEMPSPPVISSSSRKPVISILGLTLACYLVYVVMEIQIIYAREGGKSLGRNQLFGYYLSHVLICFSRGLVAVIFICNNRPCREYIGKSLRREKKATKPEQAEIKLSEITH